MSMAFDWNINEEPPEIGTHTKAKLELIRGYLGDYLLTLTQNPKREEFKLDIVDGFAGGGTYRSNSTTVFGSPLVMLEELNKARTSINQGRLKPLRFDVKFYFIDSNQAHIDHLRRAIRAHGFDKHENQIEFLHGEFEDHVENVVKEIARRQPNAGRSIFFLDQKGYSDVSLRSIRRILNKLYASEVILTIAFDHLLNFAKNTPEFMKGTAPLSFTNQQIEEIVEGRTRKGNGLLQRMFRNHLRTTTNAQFDTPFFLTPELSRRSLWLVHLSKHPKARDVMIENHWKNPNHFLHVGKGGVDMLGWDSILNTDRPQLFQFDDVALKNLYFNLIRELPGIIYSQVHGDDPISIANLRWLCANNTAARFSDIDRAVVRLVQAGEFDLLNPESESRRSRNRVRVLRPSDLLTLPLSKPLFPNHIRDFSYYE